MNGWTPCIYYRESILFDKGYDRIIFEQTKILIIQMPKMFLLTRLIETVSIVDYFFIQLGGRLGNRNYS